jgi:hypothetical protein
VELVWIRSFKESQDVFMDIEKSLSWMSCKRTFFSHKHLFIRICPNALYIADMNSSPHLSSFGGFTFFSLHFNALFRPKHDCQENENAIKNLKRKEKAL